MASSLPLWMKPPPANDAHTSASTGENRPQHDPQHPHRSWPWNQHMASSEYRTFEATLRDNPGQACRVAQYVRQRDQTKDIWVFKQCATTAQQLIAIMDEAESAFESCYITTMFQSEAMQVLGHRLGLWPSFFSSPSTSWTDEEETSTLMIQYMKKHRIGSNLPEIQQTNTSQTYRFRSKSGFLPHEWRIACIRGATHGYGEAGPITLKGLKCREGSYLVDANDDNMALRLREYMTHSIYTPKTGWYYAFGCIFDITITSWKEFFVDAETQLQLLGMECVDENLNSEDQLRYTRELHRLAPLWFEVRRQLVATKTIASDLTFTAISSEVEDLISRCSDASEQTNNLISLIFNISTLQDTRAAIQESKAANEFAASVRRVTMLTFIYLPLTLAASIFGMNVKQISGEETHSPIWLYAVVAVVLTLATFGCWFLWSQMLSRMQPRTRFSKILTASKHKDV